MYTGAGYNYMADIYSVGPLIYELVTGTLPFESDDFNQLKMKVTKIKPHIPNYLTPDLKDLLERLFEKDPKKRIGATGGVREVMKHAWFKGIDWEALEKKKVKMPFVLNLEKKKFKLVPPNLNIENLEEAAELDNQDNKDLKSGKDKSRIACFSYYSPLQKAKTSLKSAHNEIREAKKNIKCEKNTKEPKGDIDSPAWIGEFDHAETDETSIEELVSTHRFSPNVLHAKLELMNQIKMENAQNLVSISQKV